MWVTLSPPPGPQRTQLKRISHREAISVDCLDRKYSPKQPFNKKSPGGKGTSTSSFSLLVKVLENDAAELQQEAKGRQPAVPGSEEGCYPSEEQEDKTLLQRQWWFQP